MGVYSLGMPHFSARVVEGDHSPAQLGCSFDRLECLNHIYFYFFLLFFSFFSLFFDLSIDLLGRLT